MTIYRILPFVFIQASAFASLLVAYGHAAPDRGYLWTAGAVAVAGAGWMLDELLARRSLDAGGSTAPPALAPGQGRLLVAVTWNAEPVVLGYDGGEVHREVDVFASASADDLGVPYIPSTTGLHVWEGRIVETPDDGTGYEPAWEGTWRRATPAEVLRYAAGEPVWGPR